MKLKLLVVILVAHLFKLNYALVTVCPLIQVKPVCGECQRVEGAKQSANNLTSTSQFH